MIKTETIAVPTRDGDGFTAFVAYPRTLPAPALVLLHEIFGINEAMRGAARRFAEEGYLVVVPDLFWRLERGVELSYGEADVQRALSLYQRFDVPQGVADAEAAARAARTLPGSNGSVGALGFCLGGALAVLLAAGEAIDASVAYYPVALESAEIRGEIRCPTVMHFGGDDPMCPPEVLQTIRERFGANPAVKIYEYPGAGHAFYNPGRPEYVRAASRISHTRTLELLRGRIGPRYDLEALWEQHTFYEFAARDAGRTIETMVDEPYVNHVPSMTGGVGRAQLYRFYKHFFVDVHPDDFQVTQISRTVGVDRIVDEMVVSFTHDRMMDYLLPGIEPTGRKVMLASVAVVSFRGDKLYHEHIYYDAASLLAQVGVLDAGTLPIAGAEQAAKVLDEHAVPSNTLMTTWASEVESA